MNAGCSYVTHVSKKWNAKTRQYDSVDNHCNKYTVAGESMCPKHLLTTAEKEKEIEKKRIARQELQKQKNLREKELSTSPLATLNEHVKAAGYDR